MPGEIQVAKMFKGKFDTPGLLARTINQQPAPWFKHPATLGENFHRIGQMFKYVLQSNAVKTGIGVIVFQEIATADLDPGSLEPEGISLIAVNVKSSKPLVTQMGHPQKPISRTVPQLKNPRGFRELERYAKIKRDGFPREILAGHSNSGLD